MNEHQKQDHEKSLPRKQQVTALIVSGKTYQQIATELGITRQRVQQLNKPDPAIIKELRKRANGECENCGMPLVSGQIHHVSEKIPVDTYHGLPNLKYLCIPCHRKNDASAVLINCPQCGKYFKKIQYYQKFCSKECFLAHHTITLLCCNCGKSFVIGLSEYKGRLRNRKSSGFYCSKICWGKYFGAFYGLHSEYQNGKAKDNER